MASTLNALVSEGSIIQIRDNFRLPYKVQTASKNKAMPNVQKEEVKVVSEPKEAAIT